MKIIIENVENLIKGDSFVISVPETAEQKVRLAQYKIAEQLLADIKRGATLQDVKKQVEEIKNKYGTDVAKGALKILFKIFNSKLKRYVRWNMRWNRYSKVCY